MAQPCDLSGFYKNMVIVKITKGKKSGKLLKYLLDIKAKNTSNGVTDRVLSLGLNNVYGQDSSILEEQFKILRERSGKADKATQSHHIIQSFAKDEFDFNNPEDVEKANKMGLELANAIAPSAQTVVVTQADNKNGMVHNHIVLSAINLNGKSLPTNNVNVYHVRGLNDSIVLNNGMTIHKNIGVDKNIYDTLAEQGLKSRGEQTTTEILRQRLSMAIHSSTGLKGFSEQLSKLSITPVYGKRKGSTILKFKFEDEKKAYTDRKLGEDFTLDSILKRLEYNSSLISSPRGRRTLSRNAQTIKQYISSNDIKSVDMVELEAIHSIKPKTEPKPVEKTADTVKTEPIDQDYDFVQSEGISSDSEEMPSVKGESLSINEFIQSDIEKYEKENADEPKKYPVKTKTAFKAHKTTSNAHVESEQEYYTRLYLEDLEDEKTRSKANVHKQQDNGLEL